MCVSPIPSYYDDIARIDWIEHPNAGTLSRQIHLISEVITYGSLTPYIIGYVRNWNGH